MGEEILEKSNLKDKTSKIKIINNSKYLAKENFAKKNYIYYDTIYFSFNYNKYWNWQFIFGP